MNKPSLDDLAVFEPVYLLTCVRNDGFWAVLKSNPGKPLLWLHSNGEFYETASAFHSLGDAVSGLRKVLSSIQ